MSKSSWYHGSLYDDIESFKPFPHFGSRLAALHSIDHSKHYIHPSSLPREEMRPTLYKIQLDLSEIENVIELEDWGSPNAIALTNWLIKKYKGSNELKDQQYLAELEELKRNRDEKEMDKRDFSDIQQWLLDKGIKVITYLNEHEGRNGERSICIVDRDLLKSNLVKQQRLTTPLRASIENEASDLKPFMLQHATWGIENPRLTNDKDGDSEDEGVLF